VFVGFGHYAAEDLGSGDLGALEPGDDGAG
jgi:hypothetical protein